MPLPTKNEVNVQVGRAMQARRLAVGYSIRTLSDISRVSTDRLDCFEKGMLRPDASELIKIAECLSVCPSFFFCNWSEQISDEPHPFPKPASCGGDQDT